MRRLLNIQTYELREFQGDDCPQYVITSHRWLTGEASLQDWKSRGTGLRDLADSQGSDDHGLRKVLAFCKLVRSLPQCLNLQWLWIDTICIDKTNSVELPEAINSMFRWYLQAYVCIAYLHDVESETSHDTVHQKLKNSDWFTRGWTLQELLAPDVVVFLDREWNIIGHKASHMEDRLAQGFPCGTRLNPYLSEITGIDEKVLDDYETIRDYSFQKRVSWLGLRNTTRDEDHAYCMLGIFGVSMSLIYGEGRRRAWQRLRKEAPQYEILNRAEVNFQRESSRPLHKAKQNTSLDSKPAVQHGEYSETDQTTVPSGTPGWKYVNEIAELKMKYQAELETVKKSMRDAQRNVLEQQQMESKERELQSARRQAAEIKWTHDRDLKIMYDREQRQVKDKEAELRELLCSERRRAEVEIEDLGFRLKERTREHEAERDECIALGRKSVEKDEKIGELLEAVQKLRKRSSSQADATLAAQRSAEESRKRAEQSEKALAKARALVAENNLRLQDLLKKNFQAHATIEDERLEVQKLKNDLADHINASEVARKRAEESKEKQIGVMVTEYDEELFKLREEIARIRSDADAARAECKDTQSLLTQERADKKDLENQTDWKDEQIQALKQQLVDRERMVSQQLVDRERIVSLVKQRMEDRIAREQMDFDSMRQDSYREQQTLRAQHDQELQAVIRQWQRETANVQANSERKIVDIMMELNRTAKERKYLQDKMGQLKLKAEAIKARSPPDLSLKAQGDTSESKVEQTGNERNGALLPERASSKEPEDAPSAHNPTDETIGKTKEPLGEALGGKSKELSTPVDTKKNSTAPVSNGSVKDRIPRESERLRKTPQKKGLVRRIKDKLKE